MKRRLRFFQSNLLMLMVLVACAAVTSWWARSALFQDQEILWRGERLRSRSAAERAAALEELESFVTTAEQAETLRPMLLKLAFDDDPVVRARGLSLLTTLSRASLLRAEAIAENNRVILDSLRDPDARVRRSAVLCYAQTTALPPAATWPLETLCADADPTVRGAAFRGLIGSQLRWADRCATLRRALEDPSPDVRASALGLVGVTVLRMNALLSVDDETAAAIALALDDPLSPVAESAGLALGRLKRLPPSVQSKLLRAMNSADPNVARAAIGAIGPLMEPDPQLEAELLALVNSKNQAISDAATRMLVRFSPKSNVAPVLWSAHLRFSVARSAEGSDPGHTQGLIVWPSTWTGALIQLAPDSPEARKALAGLVATLDGNSPFAVSAAQTLRTCGAKASSALSALRARVDDPDGTVAREVRAAIDAIEHDLASP